MSLRDAFKTAAQQAITAFGDVAVSTNYLSHTTTSYNVTAGTDTTSYSTKAGVTVIFDEFRVVEIDGIAVKPEDKKALIPAKSISGVTPGVNDQIVADGSVTWEVQRVGSDPAGALWTLQVRRP
jgi:archaellum component FlaF (FlaF/FlaG flagellin family)